MPCACKNADHAQEAKPTLTTQSRDNAILIQQCVASPQGSCIYFRQSRTSAAERYSAHPRLALGTVGRFNSQHRRRARRARYCPAHSPANKRFGKIRHDLRGAKAGVGANGQHPNPSRYGRCRHCRFHWADDANTPSEYLFSPPCKIQNIFVAGTP